MQSNPRSEDIFVGRDRELGELTAALEDAKSGRGRLVMLSGEPGIGKTRTTSELVARAGADGVRVLWGWCYEGEGAPPYWPWVQAMRAYVREADADRLDSEMGCGAGDIAVLLPEIRDKLPGLEPAPQLDPDQARFRLFDAVATFLKNASVSSPLLMVFEDLHWSDQSSLSLWEFVGKEIAGARVMLLGTYRDVEVGRGHPLSRSLGSLIREPSFRRMRLGGLSQGEVGRLVEMSAGVALSGTNLEIVHSRTGGNPLFLNELVRLLSDEEGEATESWVARLPEGIRDVIGRRLDQLSVGCTEALTIASVLGREFTLGQLQPLVNDMSEVQLLGALEEALSIGVIEETEGAPGEYQFTHALIQETLTQELTATSRVRLHASIAESLEEMYEDDAENHASQLAYHFGEAQTALGTERLVRYSLLAGNQGLAGYAYEEALVHFQQALSAKENQPMDAEAATILCGLGGAQAALLQRQNAVASLSKAFNYYADVGDIERAVAVAEYPITPSIGRSQVTPLIERALTIVPPESVQMGNLLVRYGLALSNETADSRGAQEALSHALAIAEREGDVTLETKALANTALADFWDNRFGKSLENGLRAIELAHKTDDTLTEVAVAWPVAWSLISMGDFEAGRRHGSSMLDLADRLRHRSWLAAALLTNMMLCRLEGNWQAARTFGDRGLVAAPRDSRIRFVRTLIEYEIGDSREGEAHLASLLEAMGSTAPGPTFQYSLPALAIPMVCRIDGLIDKLDLAMAASEAVLSAPSPIATLRIYAIVGLALSAVQLRDEASATAQYTALESMRGTMVAGGFVNMDRVLGLLAQTMRDLDVAVEHFEDALAFCRKAGYRPELAWTCCDYADMLLERRGPGDSQKARALLEESRDIAVKLGMRPLAERASERMAAAESTSDTAPAYPDGLSHREVEVLVLVSQGKTNQEIADTLFITARTVANHVSNILSKTSTANRTEAASYANRHGLV